ncbi:MAG: beta-lactamase family protein [Phycisphaerales bacterium]|nr:beta-lactamase family protein [Phycisphaerales bacterium]
MPAPHELAHGANGVPTILHHHLTFRPFLFTGPDFPPCDFADPAAARTLFGDYSLKTTFYDCNFTPVTRAAKPGRYGAVIEIHHATRVSRRFITLSRQGPHTLPPSILTAIPEFFDPFPGRFFPILPPDAVEAIHQAGLHDLAALHSQNKPIPTDSLIELDKQWWIHFKRRFYNYDKLFPTPPHPFQFSRPATTPISILQSGSLAAADLKPNAHEIIDTAAQKWLNATNNVGFALCVARHNTLAICKAWGNISQGPNQGQPYTPDTIAPMASTTKFLGAILFLQFVDQGFATYDEPAARYLPALKNLPHENPPTIRDLYTHTAGLFGHWGDAQNDMEEFVADLYPTTGHRSPHKYHGVGHALGGKIMEAIANQSIAQLYKRCLIDPLHLTHSTFNRTSYGTFSSATDLIRIGQLLLNRGTYGPHLFFTPKTLTGMLPIPGQDRFEPESHIRWGVGIKIQDNDGLSPQAFAGSGATGSFLSIDPTRDLTIAMTRFEEGSDYPIFLKHKHDFIQAIKDTLI